ncbi:hypothetical protein CMUS01_03100 [Colletotrichum musicola]|uniref:Uncharacterized protein n=1 Tax=Colletotrichum musicola TaxID=2175873 RepID=A0A8H6U6V2_9PEZI|nr:hypothetical protein CMUS01_03100 [Colletotrichum musicola]
MPVVRFRNRQASGRFVSVINRGWNEVGGGHPHPSSSSSLGFFAAGPRLYFPFRARCTCVLIEPTIPRRTHVKTYARGLVHGEALDEKDGERVLPPPPLAGLWLPPTATALSTETIDETDPMMTGLSAKTPDQLAGRRTRHRSDPKLPLVRWRSTHEDGNPELQGLKVGPRSVQSCKPGVVVAAGIPAGAPLTTFSILGAILGKAEWSNKASRGTIFAK